MNEINTWPVLCVLSGATLCSPSFGHVFLMAPTGDDVLTVDATYEITWEMDHRFVVYRPIPQSIFLADEG